MTSHDVVAHVRRTLRIKQVGHAGTLDSMATGVLPLAVGKACRLIRFLSSEKIYLAEILLGVRTTTDDLEGDELSKTDLVVLPDPNQLTLLLKQFEGEQQQVPPLFSAIHYQGKRLYQLALAGKAPTQLQSRTVFIKSIELLSLSGSLLTIRVHCGGGTYVRALARDIGERIGCGACIRSLCRERSGPFSLSTAHTLKDLQLGIQQLLVEPLQALELLRVSIDQGNCGKILNGRALQLDPVSGSNGLVVNRPVAAEIVPKMHLALLHDGQLVAIGEQDQTGLIRPIVVLGNANSSN